MIEMIKIRSELIELIKSCPYNNVDIAKNIIV